MFEDQKCVYVILELLSGGDMFEYLNRRDFQISEDRIRNVYADICTAVEFMHSYGIMHRDIKLQNIMMSDDTDQAIPKMVDFGFAKIIGPTELLNEHYGSQGYTAPEILLQKDYRFEVDIWSLGVLLFVLYGAALPFASYDRDEMDRMVVEKKVVFEEDGFKDACP